MKALHFLKLKLRMLIKQLRKPAGPDGVPIKVIKIASKIMHSCLANVINQDIESNSFSEFA